MKLSKLKFVFAFVLLVAVSVVSTNVKATTMPNNGQMKISTIINSALAIVDGDDPTIVVAENTVKSFNTEYNTTILGTTMNPVQFYTLCAKGSSAYKAYTLNPGTVAEQDAEYEYAGTSSNVRVGLGLAFGLSSLTSTQLDNQAAMDSYYKAYSYATQVYVWLANNNALGTATETTVVNTLSGTEKDRYTYIRNGVEQSLLKPSYTYASESESTAAPIEMGWSEANQRYEVTLSDTNSLDTMALVNLAVQPGSTISYYKNGNSITFYSTEQVGSVSNPATVKITKSINGGRYVAGLATLKDGSNSFAYLTGLAEDNDVYYVSFYTNALKVKVQKTLTASANNSNTGDATVEGARYGVYSDAACTQLVQELTTDANGVAYTNPVEYKDYWVKELSASTGCKVDSAVYKATATTATTESNGQRVVTISCGENVIYGGFRMIVSTSPDLSGSTTKVPSVGSEITLTLDSDSSQTYTKTVDAQGYVEFTDIPYGQYTCTETKRPNVEGSDKVDLMDPMGININSEETYIYSKIVNTEVAQRYVKILKTDAESGKLVTATETTYKVVNSKGETVSLKTMYPKEQEMDEFVTADKDGIYGYVVLPEKLPADTYKVYELDAPEGYYNESLAKNQPIATFTVEPNSTEDYDRTQMVEVTTANKPQKAVLNISVTGNVLVENDVAQEAYGQSNVMRPAYKSQAIPGASYKLVAKENIVTGDGTVHYTAGQTVYEGTTDSTGKLTTKLYIGSYTLVMTAAPEGYVLDTTERTITVTAQDEKVEEYTLPTEAYTLTRQEYDLDVTKVFSELNFYKQGEDSTAVSINSEAYKDVIVGIYAAEDIKNVKGETAIAKDTLVDVVIFDEKGNGTFASEYPMGKFYAKEIATNENYQKTDEHYSFETKPTNTSDARFAVSVGEIVNEPLKETTFSFTKIEEVTVSSPKEAYEESVTEYVLSKVQSFAEGVLNGLLSDVERTTDVTRLSDAEYEIYYLDSDGKYYQLLEKVDGELVAVTRTTDENGEFTIEGLPYGNYAVKETTAPRYYDLDSHYYQFTLTTSDKDAELVLQDVRTKVDVNMAVVDEDGNKLDKVTVQLVDPDTNKVVYEEETDENGVASFGQIRAGRYIRQISGLDEKYVTPEAKELYLEKDTEVLPYEVEVTEDDVTETIKINVVEVAEVKYITGKILINKTDDETGEAVAGCLFRITDSEGNVVCEATTDDNGQLLVAGLRYGTYKVEEAEAAEGYEKSDLVAEVTITEDGHVYTVDFTNVPTGDIAVALYAVVALASVAAITMTVKKLKRD